MVAIPKKLIAEVMSRQFPISVKAHQQLVPHKPSKVVELAALVMDVVVYYFVSRIQAGLSAVISAFACVIFAINYPFDSENERVKDLEEIKNWGLASATSVVNLMLLSNPIVALGEGLAFGLALSPTFNEYVIEPLTAQYPSLKLEESAPKK